MWQRSELRCDLDRERQIALRLDGADGVKVKCLDQQGIGFGLRRGVVEVEFQRIGTVGFEVAGVFDPAAAAGAVEAGDDGDLQRRLELRQRFEVVVEEKVSGHKYKYENSLSI